MTAQALKLGYERAFRLQLLDSILCPHSETSPLLVLLVCFKMASQETIADPTLYQNMVCIDARLMLLAAERTSSPHF
jgi:hypothetical protein